MSQLKVPPSKSSTELEVPCEQFERESQGGHAGMLPTYLKETGMGTRVSELDHLGCCHSSYRPFFVSGSAVSSA